MRRAAGQNDKLDIEQLNKTVSNLKLAYLTCLKVFVTQLNWKLQISSAQ